MKNKNTMTLGELISSKGYKQKFLVQKLNEVGYEISEPHFSRICNNHNTPHGDNFYREVAKLLSVDVSDVRQCFK